jgi:cell division protein FtsB
MEPIMQQAANVFLEGLRKQSFSVILTLAGLCGLGWWSVDQQRGCSEQIEGLREEIRDCQERREALVAQVSELRVKVDILSEFKEARKK